MPYRQCPALWERNKTETARVLAAGVPELVTSEWASPIVFAPKKNAPYGFACTIGD